MAVASANRRPDDEEALATPTFISPADVRIRLNSRSVSPEFLASAILVLTTAFFCSSGKVFTRTWTVLLVVAVAPYVSRIEQMMLKLPAGGSQKRLALTAALPSATALVSPEVAEYANAYSSG